MRFSGFTASGRRVVRGAAGAGAVARRFARPGPPLAVHPRGRRAAALARGGRRQLRANGHAARAGLGDPPHRVADGRSRRSSRGLPDAAPQPRTHARRRARLRALQRGRRSDGSAGIPGVWRAGRRRGGRGAAEGGGRAARGARLRARRGDASPACSSGWRAARAAPSRSLEAYLVAHRARSTGSGPELRSVIETNPEAARDRARARRGAQGEGPARAAARHPGAAQGQRRHGGPHDHDRRLARARGLDAAARRARRPAPARRGRRDPRQGQPVRVGELPLVALGLGLERPRRPVPQPVRPRPQPVRLELGLGRRGLRQPRAARRRHRDRRLDRVPRHRPAASSASSRRSAS